VITKFV